MDGRCRGRRAGILASLSASMQMHLALPGQFNTVEFKSELIILNRDSEGVEVGSL